MSIAKPDCFDRLQRWRLSLDSTLLHFHSTGVLPDKLVGKSRHITIKENPPSCEVLIPTEELPQEYTFWVDLRPPT